MSPATSKPSPAASGLKRKRDPSPDSTDTSSSSELEPTEDVPVLSHAAKRKQKKASLKESVPEKSPTKKHKKEDISGPLKRQNSVWVGNLCFKTTPESLKRFFDGVGEITRVHLPTKLGKAAPGEPARRENRGCDSTAATAVICSPLAGSFAYVDFATPDAKKAAIAMSEQPLEGRRLLIKDGACTWPDYSALNLTTPQGDSFEGRPLKPGMLQHDDAETQGKGQSKFARKILSAQKQPPAPTLFFGNLGFETTVDSIRGLLEAHRTKKKEKEKSSAGTGASESAIEVEAPSKDPWIRKIRMGTFEDSGLCKGYQRPHFDMIQESPPADATPHQVRICRFHKHRTRDGRADTPQEPSA